MSKKYRKKASRSRKKLAARQGEVLGFKSNEEAAEMQLVLPIAEVLAGVRGALEQMAGEAGLLVIQSLLEEEVQQVAGVRYAHDGRPARRWGSEEGHVVFAGRKASIKRPRVRDRDGQEVPLTRYQLFREGNRLQEAMAERILNRVSTRRYEKVIDDVCDGYGIRKSSVSRQWKAESTKRLQEVMERPLGDLDLGVLLLDGITFKKYLLVVALGVDSDGQKHILGLWQGATENSTVVGGLLDDLIRRGLSTDRRYLFVLDGAKALRRAIEKRFGKQALIQRCQLHKERNILEHLPQEYHAGVRLRLRAAWNLREYAAAKKALRQVVDYLETLCPAAARSLEEALEETLTLHRLGVSDTLRKSLRSTNLIESCFSTTRDLCRNVKRWRNPEMAWRWAGTVLLEAQKKFRRIRGYRDMRTLSANLDALIDSRAVAG